MKEPKVDRSDLLYPELSYKLVGLAYEVFNALGPGHSERVYQRAYAALLTENNLPFKEQAYFPLKFNKATLV